MRLQKVDPQGVKKKKKKIGKWEKLLACLLFTKAEKALSSRTGLKSLPHPFTVHTIKPKSTSDVDLILKLKRKTKTFSCGPVTLQKHGWGFLMRSQLTR